jgi:hypothetical protein
VWLFLVSFSETDIKVVATILDPDDTIDEKKLRCVYVKEAARFTI